jgi:hypothetical protein
MGVMSGSAACVVVLAAAATLIASPGPALPTHAAAARPSIEGLVQIKGGPPVGPPYREFRAFSRAPVLVIGTTAVGAALMRREVADDRGRFAFDLPPGRYTVTLTTYGGPQAMRPEARVDVADRSSAYVRLTAFAG